MSIKELVNTCFNAKREYGANSEEFLSSKAEVISEIANTFPEGALEIIPLDIQMYGRDIGVRIERKGPDASHCSFCLVDL